MVNGPAKLLLMPDKQQSVPSHYRGLPTPSTLLRSGSGSGSGSGHGPSDNNSVSSTHFTQRSLPPPMGTSGYDMMMSMPTLTASGDDGQTHTHTHTPSTTLTHPITPAIPYHPLLPAISHPITSPTLPPRARPAPPSSLPPSPSALTPSLLFPFLPPHPSLFPLTPSPLPLPSHLTHSPPAPPPSPLPLPSHFTHSPPALPPTPSRHSPGPRAGRLGLCRLRLHPQLLLPSIRRPQRRRQLRHRTPQRCLLPPRSLDGVRIGATHRDWRASGAAVGALVHVDHFQCRHASR